MKTCLFVTEDWPLTPNASGGAGPLCYAHLALLAHADCEISLVILTDRHSPKGFQRFIEEQPSVWQQIKAWCRRHTVVPIERQPPGALWCRIWQMLQKPDRHFVSPSPALAHGLQAEAVLTQPDIIWAEHLLPATLAVQIFGPGCVIYSHHDWHWRIKSHRQNRSDRRYKFRMWLRRRHEETLVRRVKACVSASATEAAEVARISGKSVGYFPTTYPAYELSFQDPQSPPRIVHLGGMQTTANQIGLQRFLEVSWPLIVANSSPIPELWVIGSLDGMSEALQTALTRAKAICTGFVPDLSTVLRPYDLHVIPWEHNTGTRTRIPLALNHSQVLVTTRSASACLSEIRHGENAVLAGNLAQMAQQIVELLACPDQRRQLAEDGHSTFLAHYTREAMQPRFNQFLEKVVG